jgi:hypothetical protein
VLHENAARGRTVAGDQTGQASDSKTWDVTHIQSPEFAVSASGGHPAAPPAVALEPNLLLRDFLQERWKGVTPILWGQQLRQERLDELIYLSIMNADHLPDQDALGPMTEFYQYNPISDAGNPASEDRETGVKTHA